MKDREFIDRPYMPPSHYEPIANAIAGWPGCRVVEYGGGYSSMYWLQHLPKDGLLTVIENKPVWQKIVAEGIATDRRARLVSIDEPGEQFATTVLPNTIDIAIVDAQFIEHRLVIMKHLATRIHDEAIVYLHDAEFPCYDPVKKLYDQVGSVFEPAFKLGGTLLWWGRKKQETNECL